MGWRNKKLLVDIVNNSAIQAMTKDESAVKQMSLFDRKPLKDQNIRIYRRIDSNFFTYFYKILTDVIIVLSFLDNNSYATPRNFHKHLS